MHDYRASYESPQKSIYNLRALRERVIVRSVGVQYAGSNDWIVGKPGKMVGTRPTPEAWKVEPPAALAEVGLKNKT